MAKLLNKNHLIHRLMVLLCQATRNMQYFIYSSDFMLHLHHTAVKLSANAMLKALKADPRKPQNYGLGYLQHGHLQTQFLFLPSKMSS